MAILDSAQGNRRTEAGHMPGQPAAPGLVPTFLSVICALSAVLLFSSVTSAERIKDIASFEGMRENQLIGYGLVAGLDGTGDKGNQTLQTMVNMLQRMGVTIKESDIKAKNTAAVMVTASLPPFPKPGVRIDALVATIGDAKSLQGGALLMTPLKGPDGKVYGLAQGPLSVGGFLGGGGGTTVQKNHTTAGKVPEGVTIESEPRFSLGSGDAIRLFLHNPDFTTASSVTARINEKLNDANAAVTMDPATIKVKIPQEFQNKVVEFIASLEAVDVAVDTPARVVINERTGTVVIGENVRIAPVALAHGSLTIEIKTDYKVSQPPPMAPEKASTVVVPEKTVNVKEQPGSLFTVSGATLGEVVRALNALGVTPRDLISILQALKAAGALRAQVEII
ncbi:MAG TPA: flagellar basal body P-ring protein FlgI [Nitrospirota bacterium]|nr:flagellar basal body P-ring protein FlgI [Nitrospirota bacterium]